VRSRLRGAGGGSSVDLAGTFANPSRFEPTASTRPTAEGSNRVCEAIKRRQNRPREGACPLLTSSFAPVCPLRFEALRAEEA